MSTASRPSPELTSWSAATRKARDGHPRNLRSPKPWLTIVESSTKYDHSAEVLDVPVEFVLAQQSGDIALADQSADLIVCLGVLHHIPNVSHVLREFARVCEPGGYLVLREPVHSMGD
ncbi:class I SAM-dependent methyltransferase [Rhodococcus opacus]|uniref:class I SAM-dependent methyltransferase n=1 Tax=Rhodococcus opacus TaxID=37919 RepID=UPI002235F844|nr:class I SAM-dependent methyltransferase [Rhodococcus opacus]UZG57434.1 class I SAM-dependent methyltransferase [Rhodococcus opacus]